MKQDKKDFLFLLGFWNIGHWAFYFLMPKFTLCKHRKEPPVFMWSIILRRKKEQLYIKTVNWYKIGGNCVQFWAPPYFLKECWKYFSEPNANALKCIRKLKKIKVASCDILQNSFQGLNKGSRNSSRITVHTWYITLRASAIKWSIWNTMYLHLKINVWCLFAASQILLSLSFKKWLITAYILSQKMKENGSICRIFASMQFCKSMFCYATFSLVTW